MKLRSHFLFILCLVSILGIPTLASAQDEEDRPLPPGKVKCWPDQPLEGPFVVESDTDGDTLRVVGKRGSYSVRLMGIDTPETHYRGKTQGPWGEKAAARVAELLPVGTQVELEKGSRTCDRFGRVLAHVFRGKIHVNKDLVARGLAVNYCVFPSLDYCEEFGALTKRAMDSRAGMFSDPTVELPYDFRRRVAGRQQASFVGNLKTKKVFRPGNQDSVPVEDRVFFFGESAIRIPFQVVN